MKIIRYLEINSTKDIKESCTENYKTLLRKLKEDIKKWKYRKDCGKRSIKECISICA